MSEKLVIYKKNGNKGEDGYRTFSIRIREETVRKLDLLSRESNHSWNELINQFLDFGLSNCELK